MVVKKFTLRLPILLIYNYANQSRVRCASKCHNSLFKIRIRQPAGDLNFSTGKCNLI